MTDTETTEQLHFVKTDPSGNITILVLDPVNEKSRSGLARTLMTAGSVSAEQVAFLDGHPPRPCDLGIRMMGGEFCGNAVRSAAAWLVFDRERWQPVMAEGEEKSFAIACSGIEHNVRCTVRASGRAVFDVTAEMPLPSAVVSAEAGGRAFWRADFRGITHYCCCGPMPPEEEKRDIVRAVLREYPVSSGEAAGILFWDGHRLDPFVYVKDTDTLVNESSCGSGTAAVAACLAVEANGSVRIDAVQAGGLIYGEAHAENGRVLSVRIGGPVRVAAEGMAYV